MTKRAGRPRTPLATRFWPKVIRNPETECWEWTGKLDRAGYGKVREGGMHGRDLRAHRVGYELVVGPIPEGLTLDHLCRVRHCVNPGHLEPVTAGVNAMRGQGPAARNAAKTHCPQGHPYDAENTRVFKNGRICRTCRRERERALRRVTIHG